MPAITWVEQGWESGPWGSDGIPGELEKELLGWCEEAKKPHLCVYNGRSGWGRVLGFPNEGPQMSA